MTKRPHRCPHQPLNLYEINTRVWLWELGVSSLRDVPDAVLDDLAKKGFDMVWLMGVWAPSADAERQARENRILREQCRAALPDLTAEDLVASPYAIARYELSPRLGAPEDLAHLRARLAERGIGLILDFVPNHTACDHPWITAHPEYYLNVPPEALPDALLPIALDPPGRTKGPAELDRPDLPDRPAEFFPVRGEGGQQRYIYHGRDPYFPPWIDTAQLDYRQQRTQQAVIEELRKVARLCDGVRCDMAMLLLRDVFDRTWGPISPLPAPAAELAKGEFWAAAIDAVRRDNPGFLFLAEAYWGTERVLQQLGFDYTYDKTLYDALLAGNAHLVNAHLAAGRARQRRFVRFLENHDEERAAHLLPPAHHEVAALVALTLPGMRLYHHGQLSGLRRRLPVQLRRRMLEPVDPVLGPFYERLLACLADPVLLLGGWRLLQGHPAWPGNPSHTAMVIYGWDGSHLGPQGDGTHRLLVANLANHPAQCRVRLHLPGLLGRVVLLKELFSAGQAGTSVLKGDAATPEGAAIYRRDGNELSGTGLFVDLPGHSAQVLLITSESR